jgi:hypothetical protein
VKIRLLPLLAKLVAVTVPLTLVWIQWGREAYYQFFLHSSRPLLIALGVTGVRRDLVHDRFINYLPFIALLVITPALSLKRRVIGGLVGCVVLYLSHVGLTYASFAAFIEHGETRESMSQLFPAYLLSDALPFLLWALIASEVLRRGLEAPATSDSAVAPSTADSEIAQAETNSEEDEAEAAEAEDA